MVPYMFTISKVNCREFVKYRYKFYLNLKKNNKDFLYPKYLTLYFRGNSNDPKGNLLIRGKRNDHKAYSSMSRLEGFSHTYKIRKMFELKRIILSFLCDVCTMIRLSYID